MADRAILCNYHLFLFFGHLNSHIFVRVSFSLPALSKIKLLQKGKITLSLTNVGKSCPGSIFLTMQIYLFKAVLKNKVLT